MTSTSLTPGDRPATMLRVWDIPTRLFHWLTVSAVAIAALTGFFGPEWMLGLHVWSGYGLAALILFRIVWAFFGSEFSRFDRLDLSPAALARHLKLLMAGRGFHSIGHNPLGSAMIVGFLVMLSAVVATGLLTLGGQEKQGILAGVVPFSVGRSAREIHEVLTVLLTGMIALHVMAVLADSIRGPVNLIGAMITGRKLWRGATETVLRGSRPVAAALTLVIAGTVFGGSMVLLSRLPAFGVHPMAPNPIYRSECGACHLDFHPSLLPASSWFTVMSSLDDHFGEDASLAEEAHDEIAAWLMANASERWDTEAANSFRLVSADEPGRITATRYWQRRHRSIPQSVFNNGQVGSKLNCVACHRDARTGRFDDQFINIPKESQ